MWACLERVASMMLYNSVKTNKQKQQQQKTNKQKTKEKQTNKQKAHIVTTEFRLMNKQSTIGKKQNKTKKD